jgi:hypothetical protein
MTMNKFAILISTAFANLIVAAVVPTIFSTAHAAEGGYTNYIPGLYGDFGVAVAPEPGFYLRTDLYYYTADSARERFVQGGKIRAELDLDVAMLMATGIKVLDTEVLGGRYAFAAFIPLSSIDMSGQVSVGGTDAPFDSDRTAIGDMGIMPVSLFWNFGKFHLNAYETITLPTGSYDKDRDVNAGLNYWSFDTNLAMTYLDEDKGRELSATVGYIYHTENDDTDYQTGQEFHVDYMLNQFLSETFAIGLQGFYYKQVSGDSGSGALLGDFEGEAAGIGPALMWATKKKIRILLSMLNGCMNLMRNVGWRVTTCF